MPIYALGELTPTIHPEAFIHPDATVIGAVIIGARASVWPAAVLRGDFGRIEIGELTSVQDGTVVHCNAEWPTVIGARCVIGHNAHLEGCTVGDDCLVGSGSVILGQATIESGAGVGAGALVPERVTVRSGQIALGVPARMRQASELDVWLSEAVMLYGEMANRYRRELRRLD
jgi:carbonic anhydrase/acetyltransferase-like protein (isoleucine patch superfamily)